MRFSMFSMDFGLKSTVGELFRGAFEDLDVKEDCVTFLAHGDRVPLPLIW